MHFKFMSAPFILITTIFFSFYCEQLGLMSPENACLAGYYCNGSAKVRGQFPCPIGHYCPTGSAHPVPCPRGYFSKTALNTNLTDCKACSPGKWCDPNDGRAVTEENCFAGYVCVSGKSHQSYPSLSNVDCRFLILLSLPPSFCQTYSITGHLKHD